MSKLTTLEISQELHQKIRILADQTGFITKRLTAILLEDAIPQFRKKYPALINKAKTESADKQK